jgi:hypothetical protein
MKVAKGTMIGTVLATAVETVLVGAFMRVGQLVVEPIVRVVTIVFVVVSKCGQAASPGGAHIYTDSSSTASPAIQANMTLTGSVAPQGPMVPAPETRPTTIEGWTVLDVRGGTAVLEGPDGVRMATRGDTVPGIGRIDSIVRWGNRWIVATASGLIATPQQNLSSPSASRPQDGMNQRCHPTSTAEFFNTIGQHQTFL